MQYLSEEAIDRFRKAIQREQRARRRQGDPLDDTRLRQRIASLDRQIDRGAERVFEAPPSLTKTLYSKLDQLRAERDRLRTQLGALQRPRNGSGGEESGGIKEAITAVRNLRQVFEDADPSNVRELLSSVVSKIELHYSHEHNGKRERNTFQRGTIFLRPDPARSQLFTTATSFSGRPT